jgi:hypothetical protein
VARLLSTLGIAFLVVVVATHVAERWRFFPEMGWGLPKSPGHYLDLASAIIGVALILAGLIWAITTLTHQGGVRYDWALSLGGNEYG